MLYKRTRRNLSGRPRPGCAGGRSERLRRVGGANLREKLAAKSWTWAAVPGVRGVRYSRQEVLDRDVSIANALRARIAVYGEDGVLR